MGGPDFPIATISKAKVVIVGKNEKLKVGDHDFSKVSVILYAILIHSVSEKDHKDDGKDTECNRDTAGKWYFGKPFTALKILATQGSSAIKDRIKHNNDNLYGPENNS